MVAFLLPHPAVAGSTTGIPQNFGGKIVDASKFYQKFCRLEKSGRARVKNVDGTHLVLAGGKLVLQKYPITFK